MLCTSVISRTCTRFSFRGRVYAAGETRKYLTMTGVAEIPVANSRIVFREEFDDWAILFDPATGEAFGLNAIGAFIWKQLDGQHSVPAIEEAVHQAFADVPGTAGTDIQCFIDELVGKGFVGFGPGV